MKQSIITQQNIAPAEDPLFGRCLDHYPDVLTPDEARVFLGIGRNSIYDLLKSGQLASLKIGKLYRIPKNSIRDFLNTCYNETHIDNLPVGAMKGA